MSAIQAWVLSAAAPAEAAGEAPSRYESVVVSRPRVPDAPRDDQVAAATVIRPQERPQALDSLPDALSEAPGVFVTRLGGMGAFSTASIRGLPATQVQIYLDGVPLNLAEGGAVDLSSIPIGDAERIEIYRGVTPLAFGEAGLGGVISITSRRAGSRAPTLSLGGGSFGTVFGGTSAGAQLGRLRLYAGLHGLFSRGTFPYRDDRGTVLVPSDDVIRERQNNELRQADGIVRAALDLAGRRELSLTVLGVGRGQGISGLGQFPALRSHLESERAVASFAYSSRSDLGPSSLLQAQAFASWLRQAFDDPLAEVGQTSLATRDRTVSVGASVLASRAFTPWVRPAVQMEVRSEWFLPRNEVAGAAVGFPAERLVAVTGAEVRLRSERWAAEVVPSARLQLSRDLVTGRDFFSQFRPSTGAIVRALPMLRLSMEKDLGAAWRIKSNVGHYSRLPSMTELYGQTGALVGNPVLAPETGTNFDLGLVVAAAGERVSARAELGGFGAYVSDLIEWETITRFQMRARNVGSARVFGGEASVRLALGEVLTVLGQATYTDARNTGDEKPANRGKQLPLVPRVRGYLRAEVVPWRGRAFELRAYGDGDLTAGKFLDAANLMSVPPRLLLGAGLGLDYLPAGLRLTFSAQNLIDSRIVDLGNFPLPGRAYFVSLAWGEPGTTRKELP